MTWRFSERSPGYRCADTNFFTDRSEAGLCIEQCDPILQDCRDPTEACYLLVGDRGDCGREGGSANCSYLGGLECARGYECVPVSDTAFECRLFCEVASPPQPRCAPTESCRSFADILGSGFSETYGVCTPP